MSGRSIPILLQSNLDQTVQHNARVLQIRLRSGAVTGFAMWDRDIAYDHLDGFGEVTYSASLGFDPSDLQSDVTYAVANGEARTFVSTTFEGITEEMVRTGALDDAEWVCYLVDWRNPTPGSGAIIDAGDVGEVRLEDGMVVIPELLSYMMRLAQAVGHVTQIPCRAIYGSPANSMTGCGVDAEVLWASGEVQSVGAESDRTFTGDITAYFPGRLEFLDGPNAGKRYAIESVDGMTITLAEPTPYPISPADQYRHRQDCTKLKSGPLGCDSNGNYLNYKGEDKIPLADGVAGAVPGGQMPGGGGWTGEAPAAEAE